MDSIIYWALAIVIVCGFLAYLISNLPIIGEPWKTIGWWSIVAIGGILFILKVVLPVLSLLLGAI